jgi:hypothetical protein
MPALRKHRELWDPFCIGIHSQLGPAISRAFRRGLGGADVLGFGINERPNLIDLNALAGKTAKGAVLVTWRRQVLSL